MSLVGPRPERPEFVAEFKEKFPQYMLRHRVRSGMTGWAQVHGWRGNTSLAKRIEYDLFYIENWSPRPRRPHPLDDARPRPSRQRPTDPRGYNGSKDKGGPMKRLLFAAVAACAMSFPAAASEIRIAISKPPSYYDPRKASDSMTWALISQVYETPLLYTTAQPNGAPNLFSDVARVDNRTYVGTLVWGIVYSDGEPLTAAQMIAWLSTVRDIASRATMTAGRKGTRETITFHLKEPDQYFSQLLMTNYCPIAKEKGKGVFIGTGPYVLGHHDDREIVLERNPHYHEAGEPKVDRLVFRVFPAAPTERTPRCSTRSERARSISRRRCPSPRSRSSRAFERRRRSFSSRGTPAGSRLTCGAGRRAI